MVSAPAFLRRSNAGPDDRAPLLPQSDPTPILHGPSSAFAAPAQQALGRFSDNGNAVQSSSASFTFGRGGSTENLAAAAQSSGNNGQERSVDPPWVNARSSSFTFGRPPPMGGFQSFATAPSIPHVQAYNFPPGRVMSIPQGPVMPMHHPNRPFYAVGVTAGPQSQKNLDKPYPKLIKLLNIFSFLVLFVSAPLGVFFSYYLWYSTVVLFAGPLAAGIAMIAVFFTQWGCCGGVESSIKKMKFLVTLAAVFDGVGAFIIPLVQWGIICPDGEVLNCAYDKPIGQGFSVIASVIMLLHATLCVVTRFRTKHIVMNHFLKDGGDMDLDLEPSIGFSPPPPYYHYPSYGGMPNGLPPMSANFPMSHQGSVRDGQKKPGVPRPVRFS